MKFRRYIRDSLKRKFYKKLELQQVIFRFIICYSSNSFLELLVKKQLVSSSKISYKSRIRNYCVISGRARSVYQKFKVSRIALRFLSGSGLFFGLRKASW